MTAATMLTLAEVAEAIRMSEQEIGFLLRLGKFPAPAGRDAAGLLVWDRASLPANEKEGQA